jgi:hypothetical protein
VDTHIQAWAHGVHDYRDKTREQMIRDYLGLHVSIPIEVGAPLGQAGQFWVGHFEVALCRDS